MSNETDLSRAREIVARGKAGHYNDVYVAYKLLELAVEEVERLRGKAQDLLDQPASPPAIQDPGPDPVTTPEYLALEAEVQEFRKQFELYHKASTALMQAYRKEHPAGDEIVWPDTVQVNVWAAEQIAGPARQGPPGGGGGGKKTPKRRGSPPGTLR